LAGQWLCVLHAYITSTIPSADYNQWPSREWCTAEEPELYMIVNLFLCQSFHKSSDWSPPGGAGSFNCLFKVQPNLYNVPKIKRVYITVHNPLSISLLPGVSWIASACIPVSHPLSHPLPSSFVLVLPCVSSCLCGQVHFFFLSCTRLHMLQLERCDMRMHTHIDLNNKYTTTSRPWSWVLLRVFFGTLLERILLPFDLFVCLVVCVYLFLFFFLFLTKRDTSLFYLLIITLYLSF
jgi:hypothetical protein